MQNVPFVYTAVCCKIVSPNESGRLWWASAWYFEGRALFSNLKAIIYLIARSSRSVDDCRLLWQTFFFWRCGCSLSRRSLYKYNVMLFIVVFKWRLV